MCLSLWGRSVCPVCRSCTGRRQGLSGIARNSVTTEKRISACSLRLRRKSLFARAARNRWSSFSLKSGTFHHATLISLHAHFAPLKIIRVSLAEASRFANAVHQPKASSGLAALVTCRRHRFAGFTRLHSPFLVGIPVSIYSSIFVASRFVLC